MNKFKIFLAACICMLFTSNLFAQPCDSLKFDLVIAYHQGWQDIPGIVCIDIIWEFDNGERCQQIGIQGDRGPNDSFVGAILVPISLPVGNPCPKAPPCFTKENIKAVTIIVTDCEEPPGFQKTEKYEGFHPIIGINYWP